MKATATILGLLIILLAPGICSAFTVAGSYFSNKGAVTLHRVGDRITGYYSSKNGELTGLMFDNIFEGFWIEDGSDQRCATPKNGRYQWGRVKLEFSNSGFNGMWGNCDDKPTQPWSSQRK